MIMHVWFLAVRPIGLMHGETHVRARSSLVVIGVDIWILDLHISRGENYLKF